MQLLDIFKDLADLELVLKLLLSLLLSGLIGYEREVSQSHAGIKTHILVGVGSTIIALIQVEIVRLVSSDFNIAIGGILGSDPGRLIAQVVSGIGFLGGGTIIVTKRHVSGLTTAASIWTVAGIGLSLGMGFYHIAIYGSLFILATLFIFKRLILVETPQRIVVKHLFSSQGAQAIQNLFEEMGLDVEVIRFNAAAFGNDLLHTHVFKVNNSKDLNFSELINRLSKLDRIVSVERSNIEH